MGKVEVSQMDIDHLAMIRKSVQEFIAACAEKYDRENTVLLDIAPQIYQGAKEFFKKTTIRSLDIDPKANADYTADLCADNSAIIPANHFDFVLCTEVLEHTLQPFDAVNEMERILKKDGVLFLTVPFNFRIHGPLPDCWRFTEHGLRALFKRFEILQLSEIATSGRDLMPVHYRLIAAKR